MIQFYKGKKVNYDTESHGQGIYFTNDSGEILVDGQSYGGATSKDIEVNGGTWATAFSGAGLLQNGKLPQNITLTEILEKLLRKESFPSPSKSSTASLTTSLSGIDVSLSKTGVQEVGTPVTINAITMSNTTYGGTETTTVSGFTYGYSAENDNSRDDGTATSISVSRTTPVIEEGDKHSMTVTVSGFGLSADAIEANQPVANANASQVKFNKMDGVVQAGTNSVSATASGVTYVATVPGIPAKYILSSFKQTNANKKSTAVGEANLSSTPTSVSDSASVTGVFGIFTNGVLYSGWSTSDSSAYSAASNPTNTRFVSDADENGEYPVQRVTLTDKVNGTSSFVGYIGFGVDNGNNKKFVYLPKGWTVSKVQIPDDLAPGTFLNNDSAYKAVRVKGEGEADDGFDFTNQYEVTHKYTKWQIIGSTAANICKITFKKG